MKIFIPSPLQSYTGGKDEVEISGKTVGAVLDALDRRFPGSKFRLITEQGTIREHIKIFLNTDPVSDLSRETAPTDELQIICAISGG